MTVTNNTRRVQANGNGSTTAFNFNYEIFEQDDIDVYVDATLKTITTDYTVSGVGADSGGTVTFQSAPANGTTISIVSNMDKERTSSFATGGPFKGATVNDQLDRLVAMIAELDTKQQRTIQLPVTDGDLTVSIPVAATRASKFLSFDSAGNVEIQSNVGEWQGNWTTATAYEKNDVVKDASTSSIYIVLGDYTSGANVAADVSNEDLALVIDGTQVANATTQANLAQDWAISSSTVTGNDSTVDRSAKHYATQAATSLTDAESARDAAQTARTAAETAETNAETAETNAETAEANAVTAKTAAETAQASAETAQTGAEDARDDAVAAAGAVDGKTIADTDADTSVSTESTPDNDTITFRAGGVEQMEITSTQVTISGDLTVTGTQTVLDTQNLNITDNFITLADGQASGALDAAIIVDRGSDTNVALVWDESANKFSLQFTTGDGSSISPINDSGPVDLEVGALAVNGTILPDADDTRDIGASGTKFANMYATTFNGTSTSAQYADVAELFESKDKLAPGTVVEVGGFEEVKLCATSGSADAFGVISTNPAHLMNAGQKNGVPVVLCGRTPVQTDGSVSKGDRIVSAENGKARTQTVWDRITGAAVLGIAIQDSEDGMTMCFVQTVVK